MSPISVLRNIFTVLFTILLAAAVFTGCGKKTPVENDTDDEPVKEKWVQKLEKNAKVFRSAKAEKAVSYIAERFPHGDVAFLIDEAFYNNPDSEDRILLDEMQKRLGEKGISCDTVLTIKTNEDETGAGKGSQDSERLFAKNLNNVLSEVRDKVDIVVNFVGLPKSVSGINDVRLLRGTSPDGRNNMLLMNDAGLAFVPSQMIRNGRVSAIINYVCSNGPGCQFDITEDAAPKDSADAFDCLYYFVNADTLDAFIADGNEDFFQK